MSRTEAQIRKLLKLTQSGITPPTGFQEQLLADIMSQPEMSIDQFCQVQNSLILRLLKLTLPMTILLTIFMRIEAC